MKLISCDSVGFEVSSNIKASMFGLIRCDFNEVEKIYINNKEEKPL